MVDMMSMPNKDRGYTSYPQSPWPTKRLHAQVHTHCNWPQPEDAPAVPRRTKHMSIYAHQLTLTNCRSSLTAANHKRTLTNQRSSVTRLHKNPGRNPSPTTCCHGHHRAKKALPSGTGSTTRPKTRPYHVAQMHHRAKPRPTMWSY